MTQEIEQRIKQIGRGEVPEGYASTPAGILPEDWSCAKLSDISEIITETAGKRAIETVSISAGIGFVNQAQKFGKELSGNQYSKYTVLHRGDFAYNKGNSNRYPQGCTYMLKDRDEAAVPNVFECFRVRTGVPEYYEQLFIRGFMNKQLARLINHGVRDDGLLNLTDKDFYSVIMPLPPIDEQRRIVEVLAACDRVIELKQKLVDELKKLKKVCLTKMFPQEGETVPEIRFPDFNAPWGQRKLCTLYHTIRNAFVGTATPFYVPNGHFYLESNNVKDGRINRDSEIFINDDFYYRQKNKWLHTNDLVMVQSGHVGHTAVIPKDLDNTAAHALIVLTDQIKDIEPYFLNYQFQTEKANRKILDITTGNTVKHILASDMRGFIVDIPSLEEQRQIAAAFQSLDGQLFLYQHQLEEERKKKKALMQLLLTGIVRVK